MANAVSEIVRDVVNAGVFKIHEFNRSRAKTDQPNPYLTGVHARMTDERTLSNLEVVGRIPGELDGQYVRIGSNPVTEPNPANYHWFIGDGMVHGLRLRGGEAVWYKNRWVRNSEVTEALGEPPLPGKTMGMFDNANTNVIEHSGRVWAIVEAGGAPVLLDADLNSIRRDDFNGTLTQGFSAHPHMDPDTGELHAICYEAVNPNLIRHVVIDQAGEVVREEPIEVQNGPMIHDCMITENYVLIFDLPVTASISKLLKGKPFPFTWNARHKPRIGLLPRQGSQDDIIWCDVDPCYIYHPSNAYEDDLGNVVLDACVHQDMFTNSDWGPESGSVPFERWTLNIKTKAVHRRVIDESGQEFPRANEAHTGKPYRFAYCMSLPKGFGVDCDEQTKLYKHDLEARTRQVQDFGPGRIPGEFIFVPRPDSRAEDDGWLLGFVINTNTESTDFVILDAQAFEQPPVAEVRIPHRIPPGFHGNWMPSAALGI